MLSFGCLLMHFQQTKNLVLREELFSHRIKVLGFVVFLASTIHFLHKNKTLDPRARVSLREASEVEEISLAITYLLHEPPRNTVEQVALCCLERLSRTARSES